MGHHFTIVGDEAFALATELAALTGESLEAAVVVAVRAQVERERARQDEVGRIKAKAAEFRSLFGNDPPSSAHDWLYDPETGLPA